MDSFMFDGRFILNAVTYAPGEWYATTFCQPQGPEPRFQQGQFHIDGRFVDHVGKQTRLEPDQIVHMCRLIRRHNADMDLRQFEVHGTRPDHHRRLDPTSTRYRNVASRLNLNTRGHPAVDTALDQPAQSTRPTASRGSSCAWRSSCRRR